MRGNYRILCEFIQPSPLWFVQIGGQLQIAQLEQLRLPSISDHSLWYIHFTA